VGRYVVAQRILRDELAREDRADTQREEHRYDRFHPHGIGSLRDAAATIDFWHTMPCVVEPDRRSSSPTNPHRCIH
jgi:hypothetical protein